MLQHKDFRLPLTEFDQVIPGGVEPPSLRRRQECRPYSHRWQAGDTNKRAWLIAVAHPRVPRFRDRLSRDGARAVLSRAESLALLYASRGGIHPLENVDRLNRRPGLRRWGCSWLATEPLADT